MDFLEKVTPEYCENIVVAAIYKRHFEWYVTPRELWRMDYVKWMEAWRQWFIRHNKTEEEFIRSCGTPEKKSGERWGITVLDEKTAGKFFRYIYKCSYSPDELRSLRIITPDENKSAFDPVLYVDFDNKEFISYCPEPLSFEDFVPDGWTGKYEFFCNRIPDDKRYW